MPDAPSRYHRLNPFTKAIAATVASIGAFVIGGYLGPLAIIGLAILLEREPASSFLARFALPVIERYFPEYPRVIREMV